jgi:hypothetical protein
MRARRINRENEKKEINEVYKKEHRLFGKDNEKKLDKIIKNIMKEINQK